tara:strand:- start:11122 stop:11328 length:207 start_codon:yes stop_codon:yes gene_type:complete
MNNLEYIRNHNKNGTLASEKLTSSEKLYIKSLLVDKLLEQTENGDYLYLRNRDLFFKINDILSKVKTI